MNNHLVFQDGLKITNMRTTFSSILSFEETSDKKERNLSLRSYVDGKTAYFICKRLIDIIFSSLFIILILSWLMPVMAVLIKLDSRGPVFFVQRRVGRGGKSFLCLKFRSMVVNEEANTKQAAEDDVRITRIGKFMRVSNVDELPQFINVLLGHMSIVGPRPHMHADCSQFSSHVEAYKFRNFVRPGITGLAQVKGYRGPATDFTSIFHRYQFDAFYVRNANFGLDMRIIRTTAWQSIKALYIRIASEEAAIAESAASKVLPAAAPTWKPVARTYQN